MKLYILGMLIAGECILSGALLEPVQKNRVMSSSDFGTHIAPLLTAVLHTTGPVLEMGCGDFSTPLLHAVCAQTRRLLVSTDTDQAWLALFRDLETAWHRFEYVPVYEDDWAINPKPTLWDAIGSDTHWGVVFVDHRPGERRAVDIARLRHQADIIVAHDTQEAGYQYEPVFATFKYRYTYERYAVQTTLVSDTVNLALLFDNASDV